MPPGQMKAPPLLEYAATRHPNTSDEKCEALSVTEVT
jgi:hypothetical protein